MKLTNIWDIKRGSIVKLEGMETKFRFVKLDGIYAQIEHLYGVHKGEISLVGLGTKLCVVKEG